VIYRQSECTSGPFRIGVDVGGTFTDVGIIDGGGHVHAVKSPTNNADPAKGILEALERAAQDLSLRIDALLSQTTLFVHGSTIATNTLLERTGAKVGLLTTSGFRDTLEIRRGWRDNPWDHRTPWPAPLVPRHRRLPVIERIGVDGADILPLDRDSVSKALDRLVALGVESVAVCLLHSYRNPDHEQICREIASRCAPQLWLTLSSDLAPIAGEYERTSTAVVNAYLAPRVVPYLLELERSLRSLGLAKLLIVQSNGGVASVSQISARPISMVLSGPAAAAGALAHYENDAGSHNLISLEVGGTSCDVMLMSGGVVGMTDLLEVESCRMALPAVEITTVSAGGGSIASVDQGGLLAVGPRGAGAYPGPASYGRGGTRPTVTDAQLVLGRLKPGPYAGGSITLDHGLAEEVIRKHVAEPLSLGLTEAAAGMIRLAEQTMLHAVEKVSVERGLDPKRFVMVAGGGAGALHAVNVARLAGCQGIFVPRLAGILCAFGMCNTDIRFDLQRSAALALGEQHGAVLISITETMKQDAVALLASEGFAAKRQHFVVYWNIRYAGQQSSVPVTIEPSDTIAQIGRKFEIEHQRLFGHVQPDGCHEAHAITVSAFGRLDRPHHANGANGSTRRVNPVESRNIWLDPKHAWQTVPVFEGRALASDVVIDGPALVEEDTTTILVGASDRLRVTPAGNYLIDLQ
jgi:N-methylhydantoinase A